ncbi:MAG: sulfotransferase family protein [Myxococcota bacterium]
MPLKVIGAGFGRTGTVSTKAALEILGFGPCYHMREILSPRPGYNDNHLKLWSEHARARAKGEHHRMDWERIFARYSSTMDHPASIYYKELMETFPDAKVILNTRDSESWFKSWKTLFDGFGFLKYFAPVIPRVRRALDIVDLLIRDVEMGGAIEAESNIEIFERHNREVVESVPADQLLVFSVKEGWAPLCEFLGVEVPDVPFPHLNESKGSIHKRLVEFAIETTSPRTKVLFAVGSATALVLAFAMAF